MSRISSGRKENKIKKIFQFSPVVVRTGALGGDNWRMVARTGDFLTVAYFGQEYFFEGQEA